MSSLYEEVAETNTKKICMIQLRELQCSFEISNAARCSWRGGKHRLLFSDLPMSFCSRGRDEKPLTLPTCKINAPKVVAPNRFGTVNCLDIFARRGSWKDASHSWDIAGSAAS